MVCKLYHQKKAVKNKAFEKAQQEKRLCAFLWHSEYKIE